VIVAPDAPEHQPRSRPGADGAIDQRPRVVVLAERWPVGGASWVERDAESVVTRGVAAALTGSADVHVITPQGDSRTTFVDGAFSVHSLGNVLHPEVALRRSFLMEALLSSADSAQLSGAVSTRIKQWLGDCDGLWDGGSAVMSSIEPDLVMIAGHLHCGLAAIIGSDAPFVALPLCAEPNGLDLSILEPDLAAATAIMTTSEAERRDVASRVGPTGPALSNTGLLVAVNPTARQEPHSELPEPGYVLVLCPSRADDLTRPAELARLVALRFPGRVVAVVHDDALVVWRRCEAQRLGPVTRHMDLWRLMAWARCTVDLRPDRLVALRTVESMLLSTPAVVPTGGRAQRHVALSDGGLWYADAAQLLGCIESLEEDDDIGPRLGEQGRRYASEAYGSPRRFVELVTEAAGLPGRHLAVVSRP